MSSAMAVLQSASNMQDVIDLAEFMNDDMFTEALAKIVNVISRDEISTVKIGSLIKEFTGWGNLFSMKAQTYMTIKKAKAGTDANFKKNIYFTMAKECHEMAAALKYMTRVYE